MTQRSGLPVRDAGHVADAALMQQAIDLAWRGAYTTTPNPRVGSVVVREGRILGEGFHARAGEPHAEVLALADARKRGHDVRGATLYVTLEPCNHHGRTAPCSEAIVASGVQRVVIAMRDPNPTAAGGIERLQAAGITVLTGVLEDEARELNPGFIARMTRGTPWVRVKIAASVDGRTALADGTSQWITGARARADGHAWRARACAILTGIGTVLQDDPQLTVRDVATSRQPLRIVIDRHAQTPAGARLLRDAAVLIVTNGAGNSSWPAHVESLALPDAAQRIDLQALLRELGRREINELHVEAGARLNGALLAAGLVDELLLYVAPALIGDPARGMFQLDAALADLTQRVPLAWHSVDRVGEDLRIVARIARA
jgi:diaminohydroxyphosphoribosylaminopyrimidine deaminase / 5-amino-6-(5-phosphoribosylamino)uracil reductase